MILHVDCDGEIDIATLTDEDRKILEEDTNVVGFMQRIAKAEKKLLLIDKRPNPCVTTLLLDGTSYSDNICPNQKYETSLFDIIWQPGSFLPPIVGYDQVITFNPLFQNTD